MTRGQKLLLVAWGYSVLSIAAAWAFEAAGYAPCHLCYLQRYPHYAAIGIGALALALRARWLAWAGALAAATTAGIGIYHSGVERGWWPGPSSCTSSGVGGLSVDDLMAKIQAAPLVRCDEAAWHLTDLIPWAPVDLTMANLNAIGSTLIVFVWIAAARTR